MADLVYHYVDLTRRQTTVNDPNAANEQDASVESFVSAAGVNSAIALGFFAAFLILRKYFPMVYAPRTFLVEAKDRVQPVPPGLFSWLTTSFRTPESTFIDLAGHDNYAVVYYHRTLAKLFGGVSILAAVLLFPLHVTGGGVSVGLNVLTLGNIGDDRSIRLWANLVLSYAFVAGTLYTILRLLRKAAELRHKFLLSYEQLHGLAGYNLLIRDIPPQLRTKEAIRAIVDRVQPGHVVDVVLSRQLRPIQGDHDDMVKNRDALEAGITKYQKSVAVQKKKNGPADNVDVESGRRHNVHDTFSDTSLRPSHRKLFLAGPKVDTISDRLNELASKNAALSEKRAFELNDDSSPDGSAFVVFSDLFSPHVVASANLHETPGYMYDKQAGVDPEEVIWKNLRMGYYERRVRNVFAVVAATALVIFWSIITTFISSIASLDALVKAAPFLSFFNELPAAVRGLIQGLLPTILLAIAFSLVPVILRFITKQAGVATVTAIESSLVNQYYAFLVFNVLLVVTLTGSIWQTLDTILNKPTQIINDFATTVPRVSTFFVNYVLLLALSGPAGELLQIATLILKPLKLRFLGSTPRKIMKLSQPPEFRSGVVLAGHSFIATLGMTYAVVAPLVSVIVFVYFFLWLVAFTYNMQYVYTNRFETGGKYLHKAAKQLFVALYLHEIIIIVLFLLKQSWIQAALVILAFLVTIGVHMHATIYDGLMNSVPAKAALDETTEIRKGLVDEVKAEIGDEKKEDLEALGVDERHFETMVRATEGQGSSATLGAEPVGAPGQGQSANLVGEGLPKKYLGPDDYGERLLAPPLRSAPLNCWIAKDVHGVSDGLKREVVDSRTVRWTDEWAHIDENGKVSVESDGIAYRRFDI